MCTVGAWGLRVIAVARGGRVSARKDFLAWGAWCGVCGGLGAGDGSAWYRWCNTGVYVCDVS